MRFVSVLEPSPYKSLSSDRYRQDWTYRHCYDPSSAFHTSILTGPPLIACFFLSSSFQPRSDIVAALDNLTVLAKGGSVVYSGKNIDAVPWFEAHGYDLPSEWFSETAQPLASSSTVIQLTLDANVQLFRSC